MSRSDGIDQVASLWAGIVTKPVAAVVGIFGAALAQLGEINGLWAGLDRPFRFWTILFLAVGVDTISGVIAAKRQGKPIKSSVARRVVNKTTAYCVVVIAVWMVCQIVEAPKEWQDRLIILVLSGLIAIEVRSMLENAHRIHIRGLAPVIGWVEKLLNTERTRIDRELDNSFPQRAEEIDRELDNSFPQRAEEKEAEDEAKSASRS